MYETTIKVPSFKVAGFNYKGCTIFTHWILFVALFISDVNTETTVEMSIKLGTNLSLQPKHIFLLGELPKL